MENTTEKQTTSHVLDTPIWITIIRGFQFLLSLVILGLAARLMHDLYLDEFGLSVATAILTWVILFYLFFTEKIPAWQVAYHTLAALVLEAFLVIMWLATFAAVAARRASFSIPATVSGCFDDGSAINSKTCVRRRALEKRAYLFKSGQAMMSAIAGLGALVWLLFIATFVYTLVMFLRGRKEGRFPIGGGSSTGNAYQMEPKTEQAAPMMHQQQPPQQYQQQQQQQHYQQPIQPQPTGEYQPTPLSQNPPQNGFQTAQSPYQQQTAYQPHDQQAYNNNIQQPQQYQQDSNYQQHVYQGSELSSGTPHPQQQYTTPPPATTSPPQQYHPQQ
ncbi:hypothetical protein QQS21_006613 [Conoideocrella luteorostrata]|uniref:MARVEL domain-containing protein n=1 Tax=Conoideocrella luteorostrata TaxID=1105319 RepID=A0AAJ0CQ61_9HYPO|nr:hypothetical protein QQS21_006613 [Conoideocrella luteorostrata]